MTVALGGPRLGSRRELPAQVEPFKKASLWNLIKEAVRDGKDLTKLALPVHFNEPLSALQARERAPPLPHSSLSYGLSTDR